MQHSEPAPGIKEVLGLGSSTRRGRRWRWLALGLLLAVAAGGLAAWRLTTPSEALAFKTELVTRGDLVVNVSATGTIEPVVQVDVGSELSGIIYSINADYNDHVGKGQVLAALDSAKQGAQVLQSQAALEGARAQVLSVHATVEQTRLQLERLRSLTSTNVVSEHDLQAAQADYQRARAQEEVARADEDRAKANLNADRITLAKMVIHAPIAGIVLRRNVEVGQTVAASLQAPVLFTLADDLRKMQISVAVDEADVGKVRKDQPATFTVDAYPDRTFTATVTEVRYAPQTVAGVVTYEALLAVDNAELLLRPGMTATATITTASFHETLLVPNAALRFTPPKPADAALGSSWFRSLFGRRPQVASQPMPSLPKGPQRAVWTLRDGRPVALTVTVGATDGHNTQVLRGDVTPGLALLVDLAAANP